MVTCTSTLNALASAYVNGVTTFASGVNSWCGLATASPGTSSTPAGEASGGSPAYARKQTTWGTPGSVTNGVSTGTAVTIDTAAATYTYMLVASASSGNNMWDNATITSVTMGAQGQIVLTPTFSQT